jgi:hypothetical protein
VETAIGIEIAGANQLPDRPGLPRLSLPITLVPLEFAGGTKIALIAEAAKKP